MAQFTRWGRERKEGEKEASETDRKGRMRYDTVRGEDHGRILIL